MDNDQFGGRTDDDLFADDYETVPVEEQTPIITPAEPPAQTPQHNAPSPTLDANTTQAPVEPEVNVSSPPPPQKHKSLAQSRHAHPRPEKAPRHNNSNHSNNNSNHSNNNHQNTNNNNNKPHAKPKPAPPTAPTTEETSPAPEQDDASGAAPTTAPKAPASGTSKYVSTNTASAVSEARLGSGANPRTKPSEAELAEKMNRMRIVNAEKTRRFEQAQKDETAHAAVMARSAEEQKKRRAEEAVKRRAAEEDKKRLEEERAKNRQRKLNAMGQKEGGWDEGKEERMREEENGRNSFKGAHGGVRGVRTGGLGGSRFADDSAEGDRFGERGGERFGERGGRGGRGRGGRGGRGRGGRELFDADADRGQSRHGGQLDTDNWASLRDNQKQAKASVPKPEEFPALPSAKDKPKPVDTTVAAGLGKLPDLDSPFSPLGRWDEEVNAADARGSA
ncbi:hypothetical protein QBC39DRAFT_393417 [Podospora conica]|nr:hypothetical protein QBC39DRAFT_393417 [Schizothecium conicum]